MPGAQISQYWDADEAPAYVEDLCGSFRLHNPALPHRLFSETDAERLIEECLGPREADAFRACAIPSMQSDYFRYSVVHALGGVYSDVDYRCAGSLSPLLERLDGGELYTGPGTHSVGGREAAFIWSGFFAFKEPGHPFLRLALDLATVNMEKRLADRLWGAGQRVVAGIWFTVGPGIPTFMHLLREWGSFDALLDAVADEPGEPFVRLNCEVVDSYDRVEEAFDGVRIASHEEMLRWVETPGYSLPYKDSDVHWQNAKTAIFR